jgi:hypothetical protein
MSLVVDKNYIENPQIIIVCSTPKSGLTGLIFEYEIECVRCEDGTVWDEECNDCVPVCFDQFLEYLNNWNSSFSP